MGILTTTDTTEHRLQSFMDILGGHYKNAVGYPVAKDFDYKKLFPFMEMSLNNCGDPFSESPYKVNSSKFEVEVIDFFAELFRAPMDNYWGYVTNGGTEGNLYGLYLARQSYPKAKAYYSKAAHYSIPKNLNILNVDSTEVAADQHDEMDYAHLEEELDPTRPAIILASIGTTMREARDDLNQIKKALKRKGIIEYHIHCDAALDGMIAPFITPRPAFDFMDGADSIAVSGHKFLGCPMPCGIVICRKTAVEAISRYIPYIDGYDETISGSRNGITPLFLWYAISKEGKTGLQKRVARCLSVANYTKDRLLQEGINVTLQPGRITLVFKKPAPWIIKKWQLATQGEIAHLLTVPGVTMDLMDDFVSDMAQAATPVISQ